MFYNQWLFVGLLYIKARFALKLKYQKNQPTNQQRRVSPFKFINRSVYSNTRLTTLRFNYWTRIYYVIRLYVCKTDTTHAGIASTSNWTKHWNRLLQINIIGSHNMIDRFEIKVKVTPIWKPVVTWNLNGNVCTFVCS